MNFNTNKNDGYGVKTQKTSVPRSAYEIRADLLKLAFDLHTFNIKGSGAISPEDVVNTASTFNEFVSKKNEA